MHWTTVAGIVVTLFVTIVVYYDSRPAFFHLELTGLSLPVPDQEPEPCLPHVLPPPYQCMHAFQSRQWLSTPIHKPVLCDVIYKEDAWWLLFNTRTVPSSAYPNNSWWTIDNVDTEPTIETEQVVMFRTQTWPQSLSFGGFAYAMDNVTTCMQPHVPHYIVASTMIADVSPMLLLEWIAYHLRAGVDHFWIYVNTDAVLSWHHWAHSLPLVKPHVTFIPWFWGTGYPDFYFQQAQMHSSLYRAKAAGIPWLLAIDIDEFVYLPHHSLTRETIQSFDTGAVVFRNQHVWIHPATEATDGRAYPSVYECVHHGIPDLHPPARAKVMLHVPTAHAVSVHALLRGGKSVMANGTLLHCRTPHRNAWHYNEWVRFQPPYQTEVQHWVANATHTQHHNMTMCSP